MRKVAILVLLFMLFQLVPLTLAQETQEEDSENPPRIVFITNDNRIATVNTEGEDLQYLTESGKHSNPQWSIDGKQILYRNYDAESTQYIVINRDGSNPTVIVECEFYNCSDAVWSPDGTQIAFTSSDGMSEVRFHVADVASGEVRLIGKINNAFFIRTPAWSPNGEFLVALHGFTQRGNNIAANVTAPALANIRTGQVSGLPRSATELGWDNPVWLPNSRQFLLAISFGGLYTYDVQRQQTLVADSEIYGTILQYLNNVLLTTQSPSRALTLTLADSEDPVTPETALDPFPPMWLMVGDEPDPFLEITNLDELAQYVNMDEDGIVFKWGSIPEFLDNPAPTLTIINRYDTDFNLIDSLTIEGTSPHWGPVPLSTADCLVTAINNVNKRDEATTNSPIMGTLSARQESGVISATEAEDGFTWWQLSDESWVRGDLVTTHQACVLVERD